MDVEAPMLAATLAHGGIECDCIGPRYRVAIAHGPPFRIGVERAADAGGARDAALWVVPAQPGDAIGAAPSGLQVKDQRVAQQYPIVPTRTDALQLIRGDTNPLFDRESAADRFPWRNARKRPELSTDGLKLVFACALPPHHGAALSTRFPRDEKRHGNRPRSLVEPPPHGRAERIRADIARRYPVDGNPGTAGDLLEPGEMIVDGGGLVLRIREDGGIEPGQLAAAREEQQRRRLHTSSEREHPETREWHAGKGSRFQLS